MDSIKSLNSNKKAPREGYDLNEELGIIFLLEEEGYSLREVAEITANSPLVRTRTVHGLRYKFREGELTNKKTGEKYKRSLRQHQTEQELFTKHNVPYIDEADVKTRQQEYVSRLVFPANLKVATV